MVKLLGHVFACSWFGPQQGSQNVIAGSKSKLLRINDIIIHDDVKDSRKIIWTITAELKKEEEKDPYYSQWAKNGEQIMQYLKKNM